MRMRKKPNLIPRMERCAQVQIKDPKALKGAWREAFPGYKKLWLELGCGKGRFTAGTAQQSPDIMLIAVEKVPDAMVTAMERVCDAGIENIRFINMDALELGEVFANAEVGRIFINFCDPWPKSRDAKLRLTAPAFLRRYADVLCTGGEIHFKTDNTALFDWSMEQFAAEGWQLSEVTHDLHAAGTVGVMTDYEAKFCAEGMKINRLVAAKTPDTRDSSAGAVPRLRNASLNDSRGYEESRAANSAGEDEK